MYCSMSFEDVYILLEFLMSVSYLNLTFQKVKEDD